MIAFVLGVVAGIALSVAALALLWYYLEKLLDGSFGW